MAINKEAWSSRMRSKYPHLFRNMNLEIIPQGWQGIFENMISRADEYIDESYRLETWWMPPTMGRPLGGPSRWSPEIVALVEMAENQIAGVCEVCGSTRDIVAGGWPTKTYCEKHAPSHLKKELP